MTRRYQSQSCPLRITILGVLNLRRTTFGITFGTGRVDGAVFWIKDVNFLSRLLFKASFLRLWFRVTLGLVLRDLFEMIRGLPIGLLGNGCLEVSGRSTSSWKAKNLSDSSWASKHSTWQV